MQMNKKTKYQTKTIKNHNTIPRCLAAWPMCFEMFSGSLWGTASSFSCRLLPWEDYVMAPEFEGEDPFGQGDSLFLPNVHVRVLGIVTSSYTTDQSINDGPLPLSTYHCTKNDEHCDMWPVHQAFVNDQSSNQYIRLSSSFLLFLFVLRIFVHLPSNMVVSHGLIWYLMCLILPSPAIDLTFATK